MKYTGAYFVMGVICLMIGLNPFATAQTKKPKTAAALQENLSHYRSVYAYARPVYNGEEILVKTAYVGQTDTSSIFSVTPQLISFLDYVPPVKKTETGNRVESIYKGGYRIQIYRGKSRDEAERIRKRSYQLVPNATPYLSYSAPSYRVKVGDFLQTSELVSIYNILKSEFPSALVVPDLVNITIMRDEQANEVSEE